MSGNPAIWFRDELEKLESSFNKTEPLEDMKSFVLNAEKSDLSNIVHNVSLQPLFQQFNKLNSQNIDLLCVIVNELLCQTEPMELLTNFGSSIQQMLTHKSEEAKRVGLRLFERSISDTTLEYLMTKQISLVIDAAECLASEERSVAQGAISAFIKMGDSQLGVKALFSDALLGKLKEVMSVNDTSRFRIYEIIAGVAKISPENFLATVSSGILESLVSEVHSSDILVQLNALEVLSTLVTCNHGLNYLLEHNVVQVLANKVLKLEEEPLSLVLLPGLIEFFGNVCIQQPEAFAKDYSQVLSLLFASLEQDDQVLLGVIISTVAKIGSSCSGRTVLMQHPEEMNNYLHKVAQLLGTKNDLTLSVLNSLCVLLKKLDGDESCNQMTERWFDALGPNNLNTIVSLTKLPFAEFRISALSVLKTIANYEWGTSKLYNYAGMIEYLLDRSSEFNKDCKQMKYDVAFNMVNCPNIDLVANSENMKSLQDFVQEGPFYVPIEIEVATEGAN